MNPILDSDARIQHLTRRHFLRDCQIGLGGIALTALGADRLTGATLPPNPGASRAPHFMPKAKRVVYIHCAGSPPHLDLYDYKPELVKRSGQDCPDEFIKGKEFAFTKGMPKLLGTPRKFSQHGEGGIWLSDAVPHFHGIADEMCVVKSMYTEQLNNAPA